MRHLHFLAGVGLLVALAIPANAVTVLDTAGFEGFAPGTINGQQGWANSPTWGQPFQDALIAAAPGGGQAICFDNTGGATAPHTESSVQVTFANLTGTYRYATASFDFYREGNGLYNNLWWWPVGNNSWSGLQWDAAANAATGAQILPFGFGNNLPPNVPMPQSQWVHVNLQFDLQNGTESAWINGVLAGQDVNITKGEFAGFFFSDTNTIDPARSPNGVGQRAYVDNLLITAGNDQGAIPEPSSLALLAGALPLLGLRRRKA